MTREIQIIEGDPLKAAWVSSTPELKTAEQGTWIINFEGGEGPYTVRFIFGDGGQKVSTENFPGDSSVTYQYSKPGNHKVFATVFDKTGKNVATSKTDVIVSSTDLSIEIICAPRTLDVFDTGSWVVDIEGADEVFVVWVDGNSETILITNAIQHFYNNAGQYQITFTVTGPDGEKKSVTASIEVIESVDVSDPVLEQCIAELDPPCLGDYVTIEHTGLNGNNVELLGGRILEKDEAPLITSVEDCEMQCNQRDWCKSFDYNPLDNFPTFEDQCWLSDKNRCDANVSFTSSETHPWSYHERCSKL